MVESQRQIWRRFQEEETGPQKGELTCPRSPSKSGQGRLEFICSNYSHHSSWFLQAGLGVKQFIPVASLNSIFNPPDCNPHQSRETCLVSSVLNLQCIVLGTEEVVIKYRQKEQINKHAMRVPQGSEKEAVCVPHATQ